MSTVAHRLVMRVDAFLTRERLVIYPGALAIGATLGIVVAVIIPAAVGAGLSKIAPDFLAPWTAAHFVLDGRIGELYDPHSQAAFQHAATGTDNLSWFVSLPPVALLYIPFALLPYGVAVLAWIAISIGCLLWAVRLLEPLAPRLLGRHPRHTTVVVVACYPVFELLGAGQQSAVTLLIWAAGIRFALAHRDAPAGAIFALGMVKPQLFLFAPVPLLFQRRWRALLTGSAVALATFLLTVTTFGADTLESWLGTLASDAFASDIQIGQAWKMVGISAFLVSLAPSAWSEAAGVLGAAAAVIGAVVACTQMRQWVRAGVPEVYLWSLAILATLVVSQHILAYDAILLVIPLLVLIDRHDSPVMRVNAVACFVTLWAIPILHIIAATNSALSVLDTAWSALCILATWYLLTRAVQRLPTARPVTVS